MLVNPPPATAWWNALLIHFAAALSASSLSAFFAMIAGIASWRQVRINREHAGSQDRAVRADVFLRIADRWSRILPKRRALLQDKKFRTCEEIAAEYEMNKTERKSYRDFLCSDEWEKTMRPICNFYEILGVMLEQRSIAPEAMFVLVTVDTVSKFKGIDAEGNGVEQIGFAIHRHLQGPIKYLRTYYRNDIYEYYDKYLLEAYLQYLANHESCDKAFLKACRDNLAKSRLPDDSELAKKAELRDQKLADRARQLINRTVPVSKRRWSWTSWKGQ